MDGIHPQNTASSGVKWKAISLTHVEYPSGDFLGFLLAWCSLLPIFILISFTTLIVFRRDLHTISYFCGLLGNECLNYVVKHTVKEPRPGRAKDNLYTEYGMPSSHAQFMGFFSTYLALFLFIRVSRNYTFLEDLWKFVICLGVFLVASLVAYSRVYLVYHTVHQVLYGGLLGSIVALMWFAVVQLILTPNFPTVASWSLSEYLMIRDSTLIPNVMWFEYTSSRNEARSRLRKIASRKTT